MIPAHKVTLTIVYIHFFSTHNFDDLRNPCKYLRKGTHVILRVNPDSYRARFLNLGTADILRWMILCMELPCALEDKLVLDGLIFFFHQRYLLHFSLSTKIGGRGVLCVEK